MSFGIFYAGAMDKGEDLHLTKPNKCCQELLTSRPLRLFGHLDPESFIESKPHIATMMKSASLHQQHPFISPARVKLTDE